MSLLHIAGYEWLDWTLHLDVVLICVLLAPEPAGADYLQALAGVSRLLHDRAICEKLRGTDSTEAIHALLTESMASHAA